METKPETRQKFDELMQLEKVERHHLDILSPVERDQFLEWAHGQIPRLNGKEYEDFVEKYKALLDGKAIAEFNLSKIAFVVERHLRQHGIIPNVSELIVATQISRPTVSKYLKILLENPEWKAESDATDEVIVRRIKGRLAGMALDGNLKAMAIYMDSHHKQLDRKARQDTANNNTIYMQFNNVQINQQVIQQLTPEQLEQIEQIILAKAEKQE